jgi:hypothetical protein
MSIEELVRESLRERVETPPAMEDPAGRAMSAARRHRRRRTVVAACGATLAVVLGAAVVRGVTPDRTPVAQPPTPAPASSAFIVDDRLLRLPDGRTVAPPATSTGIGSAVQVTQGWLVIGPTKGADTLELWLVSPDGQVIPLLTGLTGPPVGAAGGQRLAWRTAEGLFIGHLSEGAGSVIIDSITPMSGKGDLIALTDDAVVLGATETGGGIDMYDLWLPARGRYVPSWNVITNVAFVYGPAPGGKLVLGLAYRTPGSKDTCLAELDPTQSLRTVRTACGLVRADAPGSRSPGGHWLAVGEDNGKVALFDLTRVFEHPAPAATWTADAPGLWVDANTMVASVSGRPERFRVGQATPEPLDVPSYGPDIQVRPVPEA